MTTTTPDGAARIAFVGDVMLGGDIDQAAAHRSPEAVWGDCLELLREADGVIGNLEMPITRSTRYGTRTLKIYRFRAGPQAVEALAAGNFRAVSLANNHILDYGGTGAAETRSRLADAGIAAAGAGGDLREAVRPAVTTIGGVRVGLIGLTDTMPEWAAAPGRAGVAQIKLNDDIPTTLMLEHLLAETRAAGADIVVLSVHWGPNLVWWPVPRIRRFAHAAVDLGVDVVHGHSSHLLQGVERYGKGLILYDTGDFVDDFTVLPGFPTNLSAIFEVEIAGRRLAQLTIHPAMIEDKAVRRARPEEADRICTHLAEASLARGTALGHCDGALTLSLD